jgi:phospholipid transport system substrate-binding protein
MKTILLVAALAALPLAARAAPGGAMAQVRDSNTRIDRILKKKTAVGSAEEQAAKSELKKIINGFIDYRELAERALAQHWAGLTKQQQQEFVATLRDLIEKNYVKRLRTNLDYEVVYRDESVKDGEARVETVVKVRTAGKSTDTQIDYQMKKSGDRWLVFDVVTDDVSMVRNYRSQFNKIITNEGYDALVRKMKKSAGDADEVKPEAKK